MGVIEEVSRYDDHVNEARMRRQKHFADRAERAIRRLQEDGAADPDVDPEIAALALGSMVARFAELWLVEDWGDYDFDHGGRPGRPACGPTPSASRTGRDARDRQGGEGARKRSPAG